MKCLPILVLAAACGSAPSAPLHNTSTPPLPHATGDALTDALHAQHLTPIELHAVSCQMIAGPSFTPPQVVGSLLTIAESAGFAAAPATFARRDSDGAIVMVDTHPNWVVDRHVQRGCQHFVGGRAWFDEVAYQLPPGARFGGVVSVSYDKHVEVSDYSETQADGSPCPPPAID